MRKLILGLLWTTIVGLTVGSFGYLWLAVTRGDLLQAMSGAGALAGCGWLGWLASAISQSKAPAPIRKSSITDAASVPRRPHLGLTGCAFWVGWILFFGSAFCLVIGGYLTITAVAQPSAGIIQLSVLFLLLSAVLGWIWYRAIHESSNTVQPAPLPPVPSQDSSPEPLPPVYYLLTVFVLPFAAIYLANHVASYGDLHREADPKRFIVTVLACLMMPAALLVLHELGHLLMTLATGFRPVEFNLGSGKIWWQRRLGHLDVILRFQIHQGFVIMLPMQEEGYQRKQFWIFAAGLLAEAVALVVFVGLTLQPRPAPERGFAAVVACILVTHLWHSRHPRKVWLDAELMDNDAHWIRHYWRGPIDVRREMAVAWAGWATRLWTVRRDPTKAWEVLQELAQRMPDHPIMLQVKFNFLTQESQWSEAAAVAKVQFALSPADPDQERGSLIAHWAYAMTLSNQLDDLHQGWDEVLASLPDDHSRTQALDEFATRALSDSKHRAELAPEALRAMDQAILLQPEAITLLGTKGSLLVELQREDEAEPILTKVLNETTSDFDRAITAIYLGIIAKRRGKAELQQYYVTLAKQNPAYATIPWLLERAQELPEAA